VRVSLFLGNRKMEVRNFPDPTPGPGEVVIEMKASGMCGSFRDAANYGLALSEDYYERAVEKLLATRGAALNRFLVNPRTAER